ncbi:MAG: hypothetical protein BWY59_00755 [Verrucomicrobia bacterium ADurb.Bin345]|nr:MAG: hypothetical protein BWY59_00755 [Verrucomicrobia bacterium ADurb.Bin345]
MLLAPEPDRAAGDVRRLDDVLPEPFEPRALQRRLVPAGAFGVRVHVEVDGRSVLHLVAVLLQVLRRDGLRVERVEHAGAVAVAVLLREIVVGILVPVLDRRRPWQHVEDAVRERRPEILIGSQHAREIRPVVLRVVLDVRHEPEEMNRRLGILLEGRAEHLPRTAPDELAQLVVRRLVAPADELADLLVVLGIHGKALEPALLRDPGDGAHARGDPRPRRVVLPRYIGKGSAEGTREAMPHRLVLRRLLQVGYLVRERRLRPRRAMHEVLGVEIRPDAVDLRRSPQFYPDAVERRRIQLLGELHQFLRGVAGELPGERHQLLLRLSRRRNDGRGNPRQG